MITSSFILAIAASSIGSGFQHGYNTAALANAEEVIKNFFNETDDYQLDDAKLLTLWSSTVSFFPVGGLIGGVLINLVASKFGRRGGLIVNNILALLAGIAMGSSKYISSYIVLMIGRFIIGVNAGLNAGICPMYLSEVSPMNLRGAMGSLYQLVITISILLAQLLGLERALGTPSLWPILVGLIVVPAISQSIALYFAPESPKKSLEDAHENKAKIGKSLFPKNGLMLEFGLESSLATLAVWPWACMWIYVIMSMQKLYGDKKAEEELSVIKKEIADAQNLPKVTLKEMLTTKKLRKPLIIICVLMISQQCSGINAIIFYSTEIFKAAGLSKIASQWATVGIGAVNVIMTLLSVFLIEIWGRKTLLLGAFTGMTAVTAAIMICLFYVKTSSIATYLAVCFVYLYIIVFATGPGSIPWLLGSELFLTAARPIASSIAVPTNWFCNFVVALAFPALQKYLGPYVFIFFIVFQTGTAIFVWIYVPETKNIPIDEITAKF